MSSLRQIGAITLLSLRSLPQRLGTSAVIVIGIAGVAGVLLSIMAMAAGLQHTVAASGHADRAFVLRSGSTAEMTSGIARDSALTIMQAAAVRRGSDGAPIASADTVVSASVRSKQAGEDSQVILRGVGSGVLALRPEIKIVEGRMFRPAVRELIVGRAAQRQFVDLHVGDHVALRDSEWTVVGVFDSNGDAHESELLADAETVNSAFRRNGFQSVTVQLTSADAFDQLKDALTTDPTLSVSVVRESQFYADQSKQASRLLYFITYFVGAIMAVGAVFSALNSMYSAVSTRAVEIATLRAIGFGAAPVVTSVLTEALLLAAIGGAIGVLIAWILFDGHTVSTLAGGLGFTQMAFELIVTPGMLLTGMVWACAIGLIGALLPSIRAARLPVAMALRAL